LRRVVVLRRNLVVANQTLQAGELRDELRKKLSVGPCSFFVLVPDTKAADYGAVAAGALVTVILAEFGDFPMMRKMLLGIKQRAEMTVTPGPVRGSSVTATVRRP
jgi:hypothetical protein